jgi:hypothetical protein
MGRIAHRPLLTLREIKSCDLRGLSHSALEDIDGIRLDLLERRGCLGFRTDDVRGPTGGAC